MGENKLYILLERDDGRCAQTINAIKCETVEKFTLPLVQAVKPSRVEEDIFDMFNDELKAKFRFLASRQYVDLIGDELS